MPLQPIRFKTPEDVYAFLEKLKKWELLTYSEESNYISSDKFSQLVVNLVMATNGETYYLPDVMAMPDNEMLESDLLFPIGEAKVLNENETVNPVYTGKTFRLAHERLKMWNECYLLLHNKPLAQALLKLNPNPSQSINLPQIISDGADKKEISFPIITRDELTVNATEVPDFIFSDANMNFHNTTNCVDAFLVNYALADLIRVNHLQMLNQYAKESQPSAKIKNLMQQKKQTLINQLDGFKEKMSQLAVTFSSDKTLCEDMYQKFHEEYKTNQKVLEEKEKRKTRVVSKMRHKSIAAVIFSETLIPPALLIWRVMVENRERKKLNEILPVLRHKHEEIKKYPEDFIEDQKSQLSVRIITPCFSYIESFKRALTEEAKEIFAPKRSALQANSSLAAIPLPPVSATAKEDRPTTANSL